MAQRYDGGMGTELIIITHHRMEGSWRERRRWNRQLDRLAREVSKALQHKIGPEDWGRSSLQPHGTMNIDILVHDFDDDAHIDSIRRSLRGAWSKDHHIAKAVVSLRSPDTVVAAP